MNKRKLILVIGYDGYIGFPLTMRLLTENHVVYGIDNYSRRQCVEEMGSVSATDISNPYERRELLYKIGNFTHKDIDSVKDDILLESLIKRMKFDVIINLGHNPSAPYSQIDRHHANNVLLNNIVSTNNILWFIKKHCPDCHYLTIGSTGEYNHSINVDIEEGYFSFEHKQRKSKKCLFPREANSIYHACYDNETEVLTQDGWKYFKNLSKNDLIATLNKETDTLEYQYPVNLFEYDYDGDLINICNRSIDLNITPNHNVFTTPSYKNDLSNWYMEKADDMFNKNRSIRRSVLNWQGTNCYITLDEYKVKVNGHTLKTLPKTKIDAKDFIDFFGWWITEGCLQNNRYVNISQQKIYNFDDIIESFNKLNLNRKVTPDKSRNGVKGFMISHPQLFNYLKKFGKSKNKFIPKEIKNLPKYLLQRLLMIMIKGDGHLKEDHYKMSAGYYTISKQLADDIQEICLKCGYVAVINEVDRNNDGYIEYNVHITDNLTTQLIMSESVDSQRKSNVYTKNKYKGKVYCCEVPNSIIYVRRNGKPCWCGNSKISSTYMIDYLARLWDLKCTDVMQSVVYGIYTPECDKYKEFTRLDTDDAFGTVIHRFIIQSLLNKPLTVYGHGMHKRGFLSLNDSIQALMIAVNNEPKKGEVQTWNQLSEWYSINELVDIIKKILPNTKTININSPRHEFTGGHYYKYNTDTLKNLGYKPTRTISDEIRYIFKNVDLSNKSQILENVIQPKIIF